MDYKNWSKYLEIRSSGYIGPIVDCTCGWIGKNNDTIEITVENPEEEPVRGCPDCRQPINPKFI